VKTYMIDGFTFRLKPMTLALREEIDTLFASAGVERIDALLSHMANEVASTMHEKRLLSPLCNMILEFADANVLAAFWRRLRMRWKKIDQLTIVRRMQVPTQVEVFTDFFVERLGAAMLFADSLKNMASSLAMETKARELKSTGGSSQSG
jgi:hypothetical protein